MVEFSDPSVMAGMYPYLKGLQAARGPVFDEMEALAARDGFPIIGPLVGALVEQQARMIGATRILELGSGYGYSAAWFTKIPEARVICTEGSEDNARRAEGFLSRLGVWDRVDFQVGHAQDIARGLTGPFDVVFCDIDKQDYPEALELGASLLRVGGLLIFDNVIWSGYAWAELPEDAPDYRKRMTPGVRAFNRAAYARDDFLTTIMPLRDGVALALKLR